MFIKLYFVEESDQTRHAPRATGSKLRKVKQKHTVKIRCVFCWEKTAILIKGSYRVFLHPPMKIGMNLFIKLGYIFQFNSKKATLFSFSTSPKLIENLMICPSSISISVIG